MKASGKHLLVFRGLEYTSYVNNAHQHQGVSSIAASDNTSASTITAISDVQILVLRTCRGCMFNGPTAIYSLPELLHFAHDNFLLLKL